MKRRFVGKAEVSLTEIGFGASAIAGLYRAVSRDAAEETLTTAWEAGIRYFDTAPFYGFGLSERRLGDFLRDKPRESYVLSSKVGRLLHPAPDHEVPDHGFVDPLPFRPDYDYTYDGVMRSLESSLARLGLNRIDILYVHDIGAYTHGPEADRHLRDLLSGGIRALDELRTEGAIRAFGLGVNEVEICLEVLKEVDLDCLLLANRYTLLDRTAGMELIPECSRRGVSLVIGGVFNSGILATGPVPGAHYEYGPAPQEILDRVASLERIASSHGVSLAAAALQFPLRNPAVSSVLIGTAKPESLIRNLRLLEQPIRPQVWDAFA
jgi:D-threo-aldose 1-dehydrogenase